MIGDEPGTPLRIRTLLKKLYPAAKTDADRCCWARLPSPTASATHTELGPRRVLRGETSRKAGCGIYRTSGLISGTGNGALPHGPSHRARPRLYVRPDGAYHQWRRVPPGELSIAPVADERFGRATDWAGAS